MYNFSFCDVGQRNKAFVILLLVTAYCQIAIKIAYILVPVNSIKNRAYFKLRL